jgi:acyl-CoA thioesterase
MVADLAVDTAARADPDRPGRYHVDLPDHWDFLLPSGGVLTTCALRAAAAHLAAMDSKDRPPLRVASATTIFPTPIRSGPLVIDVHVLRHGGATAQVRVELANARATPEDVPLELLATFCRDRKGPDVIGVAFPSVNDVAAAPSLDDGAPKNPHTRFRFYHQLESRLAEGAPTWTPEFAAGPARYAQWFRYKLPQRDLDRFDRLALPPLVDTMPPALHRAIGPGAYRFHAPSLDLTLYFVDDTAREWLLVDVRSRRARAGWAIADAEVWDDEGRLLAYGSQAMYLHGLSGEPPVIDASRR